MPDWSYQTIFRPCLAKLPYPLARKLALGTLGVLGRTSIGRWVIGMMGHMVPDPRLITELGTVSLCSPVVLSHLLDRDHIATEAFTQFGLGLIELGSVQIGALCKTVTCQLADSNQDEVDWNSRSLILHQTTLSLETLANVVQRASQANNRSRFALRVKIDSKAMDVGKELKELVAKLNQYVSVWILELDDYSDSQQQMCSTQSLVELVLGFSCDEYQPTVLLAVVYSEAKMIGDASVVIRSCQSKQDENGKQVGIWIDFKKTIVGGSIRMDPSLQRNYQAIQYVRDSLPEPIPLVVHLGMESPAEAIRVLKSGATAVAISSGFVFGGPGLAKRINAAELYRRIEVKESHGGIQNPNERTLRPTIASWAFGVMLGAAMFGGGLITLGVGVNGVLLPYDEVYLGMSSQELAGSMPQLVHFMMHDRVTVAGTMLAIGIIYMALSWFGIRRGHHWAKIAMLWSAMVGFTSFFLFLVFGYFDPLHAFISAVCLQLTFGMAQTGIEKRGSRNRTCVVNDIDWRFAQWGQLLLVIHGISLCAAGATICVLGSTQVFVQEDLVFMNATREQIASINPKLLGIVAHDRATFGGMLLACGLGSTLPAMWGFERQRPWLFWMLLTSGTIAYLTTIAVHACVGYLDLRHLLPAFMGLSIFWIALGFSARYLCSKSPENDRAWDALTR